MKVLDIGAGAHPEEGTTHAIEIRSRGSLKQDDQSVIKNLKYKGLTDYDIAVMKGFWNDIHYKYGVNFNKDTFPFPNKYFDKVVSTNALTKEMTDGNLHAFKEAHRVLKTGGLFKVKFDINPEDRIAGKTLKFVMNSMRLAGFHNISSRESRYTSGYNAMIHTFPKRGVLVTGVK